MFNQLTVLGRLGSDPEMRYTANGKAVTNFSVATDVGWGDNKETLWLRVNCWDKQAESANQYLEKGRQVLIVGELSQREYTAANGDKRTSLEVKVREMKFINDGQQSAAPPAPKREDEGEALPW
jgi:single-strand DNA-binding protein